MWKILQFLKLSTKLHLKEFWDELESEKCFQWQYFTTYFRPTLLFMKKSELLEKFIFCFSRIFWYDEWYFQFDKNTGHYAIMLWSLDSFLIFPKFLILNSFGNSWGNSYLPCLQVIIAHYLTYYEIKIW